MATSFIFRIAIYRQHDVTVEIYIIMLHTSSLTTCSSWHEVRTAGSASHLFRLLFGAKASNCFIGLDAHVVEAGICQEKHGYFARAICLHDYTQRYQ